MQRCHLSCCLCGPFRDFHPTELRGRGLDCVSAVGADGPGKKTKKLAPFLCWLSLIYLVFRNSCSCGFPDLQFSWAFCLTLWTTGHKAYWAIFPPSSAGISHSMCPKPNSCFPSGTRPLSAPFLSLPIHSFAGALIYTSLTSPAFLSFLHRHLSES